MADAHNKLLSLTLFTGVLLIAINEDASALSEFLRYARTKHPNLVVVAVLESMSLAQMRNLVGIGVDHVLLRPFNVEQLVEKIRAAETFRQQVLNEVLKHAQGNFFETSVERITDKYFKISLRGWLVENCELPNIPLKSTGATLFLDCDQMKGINSIGIRSWVLWLKALMSAGFTGFEFDNLHPPILQQASLTHGFVPTSSVINSFYLYYWSEEAGLEKEFRMAFGKNYGTSQMKLPKVINETQDNKTVRYELDESALKILKFYGGTIDIITSKDA